MRVLAVWRRVRPVLPVAAVIGFALWVHWGSGIEAFRANATSTTDWVEFRTSFGVDKFGSDGYFTRAVQNGYNLFHLTPDHGRRFTRKAASDEVHSCAGCHTVESLAYSLVNSDRFDAALARRVSFEERVMRCYAGPMDGFVPTLYDPAIRDIRILARAVANHLQLSEGARPGGS